MKIENFSPLQSELANKIWACETPEQVTALFDSLPKSLLHDAYVVYRMIIYAYLDEQDLGDMTEAQETIDYIRSL